MLPYNYLPITCVALKRRVWCVGIHRITGKWGYSVACPADIKFVAEGLAECCQPANDRGWATARRDAIDDAAQQGRVFFGEFSEVDVFGQVSGWSCWDAAGAATAVVAAVTVAVGVVVNGCGGAGDGWGAFWGSAGTEGENPECCHNPCFGLLHTDLPEFVLGPPSLGLRFKSKEQLSESDVKIQILDLLFLIIAVSDFSFSMSVRLRCAQIMRPGH